MQPPTTLAAALAMHPFEPSVWLRNPHYQTIAAALWPRDFSWSRLESERRLFLLPDGSRIAVDCSWQPDRTRSPTLIVVHGLEGSSNSPYMLGVTHKAYHYGFNVARLNLRNCGGTEHQTETLYHAGQSDDVRLVVKTLIQQDGLDQIGIIGFSMGGNICLKLAGEWGTHAPKAVLGVVGVSPLVDLTTSWQLIERLENTLYRWMFVWNLKQRIRRKAKLFPDRYDVSRLRGLRTIRHFDERYQAPCSGFADADDYYRRASALPFLPAIRIPTLILHAEDDPILPVTPFRHPEVQNNPYILTLIVDQGGHVGFIARNRKEDLDCYWAENRAVEFFRLLLGGIKQNNP